jgi:hypothetical protein
MTTIKIHSLATNEAAAGKGVDLKTVILRRISCVQYFINSSYLLQPLKFHLVFAVSFVYWTLP